MKPVVSIAMPYFNDPDMAIQTLESLYSTIDIDGFEVIVIDDGSKEKIPKDYNKPNLRKYRHFTNLGVGAGFDTAVSIARGEYVFLIGSDIKFLENGWARRMLNILKKRPTAIVCTGCGSTKTDNTYYGADIKFFVGQKDLSEKHPQHLDKGYRSVLQGKWRPRTGRGVYAVPSLMGAFYGVKKNWYNNISGFEMHYKYGSLEPYISLKSWRMGGEVLVDSLNRIDHEFDRGPNRFKDYGALIYNQLMMSAVVFGHDGGKYAMYLNELADEDKHRNSWQEGSRMYADKTDHINWLAGYVRKGSVMTPKELEEFVGELNHNK